jgi:hypothetical protein
MYLTPYGRNALAQFAQGVALGLSASWWIGLAYSIDSAGVPEEVVDSSYFRVEVERSLTAWAGTQGPGSLQVSSGNSHETSNNEVIDFGSAAGSWGSVAYVVFYDQESGGNAWFAVPFTAIDLQSGNPASFQPGAVRLIFGIVSGTSRYLSNSLIDHMFRNQAFVWPATVYVGYTTTDSTASTPGTEPSIGTGYGREPITSATGWTDDADGTLTNANLITFNDAILDQGDAVGQILMDAASGGNLLFYGEIDGGPVSVRAGEDPPRFPVGSLEYFFA